MSLRIATGTDGPRKERKGLKRKFAAYAGLAFGLILIAGLLQAVEKGYSRCRCQVINFCGKELKRCYG